MADPYSVAYGWLVGWYDAHDVPFDRDAMIMRTVFAKAWAEYHAASKQKGESLIYIRTAWEQWQETGKILG